MNFSPIRDKLDAKIDETYNRRREPDDRYWIYLGLLEPRLRNEIIDKDIRENKSRSLVSLQAGANDSATAFTTVENQSDTVHNSKTDS